MALLLPGRLVDNLRMPRRHRGGWRPWARIRNRLLALVAIPVVLMTVIVGYGAFASVHTARAARAIAPLVDRSALLLQLQIALTKETFLSATVVGAVSLQIPLDVVESNLNVDVTAELLRTRRTVDQLLDSTDASVGLDREVLGTLRDGVDSGSGTIGVVLEILNPAISSVREASEAEISRLERLSASVGDAELQVASDALTAINEAAQANADRVATVGAVLFPDAVGRMASPSELAGVNALYHRAIERLSDLLEGDALRKLERVVVRGSDSVRFDRFVTSLAASGELDGRDPSAIAAFSGGLILQDQLDEVAHAAQANLTFLGAEVEQRSNRVVGVYVLGLLVATAVIVAGAALISRSVVRPLDELAQRAGAVVSGRLDVSPLKVRGPIEIAAATAALNEAVANLGGLNDAIDSMARGDTQLAIVSAPAGPLGEALAAALDRLSHTIIENEHLRERLAIEAVRDPLTGLANRRLLTELLAAKLSDARRAGAAVGVLFLDLDGFKSVNDVHGHAAGDMVLRQAADRLTKCARSADVIARYGGDEFAIVGHTAASLGSLRKRVDRAMSRDYLLDGGCRVHCPASIGAAYTGDAIVDADELLTAADEAMYTEKRRRSALAEPVQRHPTPTDRARWATP